jgi:hypothetical protein
LDGKPIQIETRDIARSVAIHPDGNRFILGTSWSLRALQRDGKELWQHPVPSEAWAVNISGDGRLVVAAYGDGTIRWHRMDDGRELLAFMPLADRKNWVAWSPEGFYAATPGVYGVLQWEVNHGPNAAAATVPVSAIQKLRRPDALPLIIQGLETARALGIADLAAARSEVQIVTGAEKPPGARLHVLAIGVSDYGENAKNLRLRFADNDARDVASALLNTQGGTLNKLGGLYAEVLPTYLSNSLATKAAIADTLAAMEVNMAKGVGGEDMAVVMFSGHGAVIDDRFYLLPYGVDASTPARIKASAISASEFKDEIAKLATHGRVLLLLDACRSGAISGNGITAPNADLLRAVMASSNVTVLTSSTGDKPSREYKRYGHGAFTEVLLEALGRDTADTAGNGLISMSELTAYMARRLPAVTKGRQQPGMEQRFQSDVFAAGL